MNLNLTPQLETFVRERAESGDYNNASEVVREAIRLLKQSTEEQAIKLHQLRNAITDADIAVSSGKSHVFNSTQELDHFFDQL